MTGAWGGWAGLVLVLLAVGCTGRSGDDSTSSSGATPASSSSSTGGSSVGSGSRGSSQGGSSGSSAVNSSSRPQSSTAVASSSVGMSSSLGGASTPASGSSVPASGSSAGGTSVGGSSTGGGSSVATSTPGSSVGSSGVSGANSGVSSSGGSTCGNGNVEGGEQCDDGMDSPAGDGCNTACRLEPNVVLEVEPNDDGMVAVGQDDFEAAALQVLPAATPAVRLRGALGAPGDEDYFLLTNSGTSSVGYNVAYLLDSCTGGMNSLIFQTRNQAGSVLQTFTSTPGNCGRFGVLLLPGESMVLGLVAAFDDTIHPFYFFEISVANVCGDGTVEGFEQCEPPNSPGCNQVCQTTCGDALVLPPEECDDGPAVFPPVNGDGCSASCTLDHGAHGEVEPNEDGMPDVGMDDFAPVMGPEETGNAVIFAGFNIPGDEDVFRYHNPFGAPATVTFRTSLGNGGPCRGSSLLDTVLILRDAMGMTLAQNDDDWAEDACSRLTFDVPAGSVVFAHVLHAGDNQTYPLSYRLTINVGSVCGNYVVDAGETCDDGQNPPLPHDGCSVTCQFELPPPVTELEPNDDGTPSVATGVGSTGNDFLAPAAHGPLTQTTLFNAAISPAGDEDELAVVNTGPASVTWQAETFVGTRDACTVGVNTVVNVLDSAGTTLTGDDDSGVGACSLVVFSVPAGQTRYVQVLDSGDNQAIAQYSLLLQPIGRCGNGRIERGEVCDDGNTNSMDGCSTACGLDPGYTCTVPPATPSVCTPLCGNNQIEEASGETCDDGARDPGDGCSANCREEPGFTCRGAGFGGCSFTCGNGQLSGNELCDDRNLADLDGCSSTCQLEVLNNLSEVEPNDDGTPTVRGGFAGNDFLATAANGPFTSPLRIDAAILPAGDEDAFAFTNPGTQPVVLEAETFVDFMGACSGADTVLLARDATSTVRDDDGGVLLCSKLAFTVAPGQTVYVQVMAHGDNSLIPGYGLLVHHVSACGDGVAGTGEQCDDGNALGGDGCSPACTAEAGYLCSVNNGVSTCGLACGNNQIDHQAGEACDDGAHIPGDGCDASCHVEPGFTCLAPGVGGCSFTCGNALMSGNEQCDDGDLTSMDGCSDTCRVEPGYTCVDTPTGSNCQLPPANTQCAGATEVRATLTGQNTAFSSTMLTSLSCGPQNGPVLFYWAEVPPRSILQARVPTPSMVLFPLDSCATQACTGRISTGPGGGVLERANAGNTPTTLLFAVGTSLIGTGPFDLTTAEASLDVGASCAAPLPLGLGPNGPFAVGGGADNLGGVCLPGAQAGVTYHTAIIPPQGEARFMVLPAPGLAVAARLLSGCATSTCLAQGVSSAPGQPAHINLSNPAMMPQTVVLAVGVNGASGLGTYSVDMQALVPGSYTISQVPATCIPLGAPLTLVPTELDDGVTATQALPFAFNFFGTPVTQYTVATNGFLQLYTAAGGTSATNYNNAAMPDPTLPNGLVAPLWDDLRGTGAASLSVQTVGAAPARTLVVEWDNWQFYADPQAVLRFQAHLMEGTSVVEFHYCTLNGSPANPGLASGSAATIGLEDLTGNVANAWSFNTASSVSTTSALRFQP